MGDVATAALGGGVRPGVAWAGRARSARRCLFGPPDPEKTRDFLESETERLEGESRAKWNFDFVSERPLDCGRFVWTEVGDHGKGTGKAELQTRITGKYGFYASLN